MSTYIRLRSTGLLLTIPALLGCCAGIAFAQSVSGELASRPDPLSEKEKMIRDRFVRFQDRVFRLRDQLSDKEPANAERLARTLQRAGELGLSDELNQIIELLRDPSRLSDASDAQEKWIEDANRLLAILLERDGDNQERRDDIERLEAYKQDLQKILAQQQSLRDRTGRTGMAGQMLGRIDQAIQRLDAALKQQQSLEAAASERSKVDSSSLQSLENQQSALADDTGQLAEDIAALGTADKDQSAEQEALEQAREAAKSAGDSTSSASSAMSDAANAMKQGNAGKTSESQQSAAQALQRAKQQLQAAKKAVEQNARSGELSKEQRENARQAKNLSSQIRGGGDSKSSKENAQSQAEGKKGGSGGQSKSSESQQGKQGQQSQSGGAKKHEHGDPREKKKCLSCNKKPGVKQIEEAEDQMDGAAESLDEDKPDEAAPKQDDAIDNLQQALNEIEESLQQLRTEEREEVLRNLEDRFRDMLGRQRVVNEGTLRLHERMGEAPPRRAELLELSDLASQQRTLEDKAAGCVHILDEEGTTIAFPRVVGQITEDMGAVAGLLSDGRVGSLTQQMESDIVDGLEQLLDAVKKMQRENQKQASGSCPGGSGKDKPLLPPSAELKLLRSSQMRVNQRTVAIHAAGDQGSESPQVLNQGLQATAARQLECAEIARQIRDRKNEP